MNFLMIKLLIGRSVNRSAVKPAFKSGIPILEINLNMDLDDLYDESLNPKKKALDDDLDGWESPELKPQSKHIKVQKPKINEPVATDWDVPVGKGWEVEIVILPPKKKV